jgi:RNA polymerase sigma factor for flagellar operon FliA
MSAALSQRLETVDREKLILDHYPMVRRIAYRLVARYPSSVDVDDLITIGMLGLIEAVDRFEHDRSVSFSGYARIRVQGAIVDELRKQDWVPRSVRDRADRIRRMRETLEESLGRPPSETEIASALGVEVERLQEITRNSVVRTLISMDESEEDEQPIRDQLATNVEDPLSLALTGCLRGRVLEAVAELPERERQLVELYYFRNRSIKQIASTFGVTESRISQLHTRTKKHLAPILETILEAGDY